VDRDPLTDNLLRSLDARAQATIEYLAQLRADSAGGHEGLRLGIEIFADYATKVVKRAEDRIRRDPSADGQAQTVRTMLAEFLEREKRIDELFARGSQVHVPGYLAPIVARECEALGLPDRVPLLAVGPPGRFETYVGDLYNWVFTSFPRRAQPTHLKRTVALVSLAHLEGLRALWLPVVVGHELGHLAIIRQKTIQSLRTAAWLPANAGATEASTLARWAGEVICDLNAVRRFGVAGIAALAEFLEVVGATAQNMKTHPPAYTRMELMLAVVNDDLSDSERQVLQPYRAALTNLPPVALGEGIKALPKILVDHVDELNTAALALGRYGSAAYDRLKRRSLVEWLAGRVEKGIPGGEVFESSDGDIRVTYEDMINAGWQVRARSPRELPVDQLVGKAIDTLEFLHRWGVHGGDALRDTPYADPPRADSGLLGSTSIAARLASDEETRLIVTPRLPNAVQGSALDVRLANQFIVFLRTSTATFDALAQEQDPRQMQRLVGKAWGDAFILHPGELVLAATLEYIVMPPDLGAQVVTRSSYGRLGLLVATAIHIHPWFQGVLTLELVNLGQMPLTLTPGERIGQVVFFKVDPPSPRPAAKYHYPVGPEFSKVRADPELGVLRAMSARFMPNNGG
jgi:deoxycytidine triphosphate deaminase